MSHRHRLLLGLAALLSTAAGGCVRERMTEAEAVYTIEPSLIVFASIAAWCAAFLGWMIRRSRRDLGLGLMIGGTVLLLTTVPALVASWVRVSDDGVEWRRGLVARSHRFAEMERIDSRGIAQGPGPGQPRDIALLIRLRGGEVIYLSGDRSNPLIRASAGEIVRRAERRGVKVNPKGRPVEIPMIDE